MDAVNTFGSVMAWVLFVVKAIIAMAGLAGAVVVATTRADAFEAGDRLNKWAWCAILVGSSLVVYFFASFIWVFGVVAIGVYWFDVFPQLRDIQRGDYY